MDRHLEQVIGFAPDSARAEEHEAGRSRILRAKYLDWCSARIAERFLELTPDEIYELAQRASRESSRGAVFVSGAAPPADASDSEPIGSFRTIVDRVTDVLASTVELPTFEDWAKAYTESPARYDEELLGFWKEGEADSGKE